ncbi:MAG TPA: hypothetical protein DCM28_08270 [Phycisphaerales bacterium]|nr:hypothetical protein [Phycisphaerales bacterium]HCD34448.1 hypothetical protein [Phycisphaerales bacterium]|tara:strand:+ start:1415 stop:1672 length:258 start_codon:yes stop_codon:yes gene_type:complete
MVLPPKFCLSALLLKQNDLGFRRANQMIKKFAPAWHINRQMPKPVIKPKTIRSDRGFYTDPLKGTKWNYFQFDKNISSSGAKVII